MKNNPNNESNKINMVDKSGSISIPIFPIIIAILLIVFIYNTYKAVFANSNNDKQEEINILEISSAEPTMEANDHNDLTKKVKEAQRLVPELDEIPTIIPTEAPTETPIEIPVEVPADNTNIIVEENDTEDLYFPTSIQGNSTICYLSIPNLGIEYTVLSETSNQLMNISLTKYWGADPNEVGNMVIVGHNYRNDNAGMFSNLHNIGIGENIYITDLSGRTVCYTVYDTYVIDPYDNACTSQLTNGNVEITLITCYNYGTERFVVKARA